MSTTKDMAMRMSCANDLNLPDNGSRQRATITEMRTVHANDLFKSAQQRSNDVMNSLGKLGQDVATLTSKVSSGVDENYLNNMIISPANTNNYQLHEALKEWGSTMVEHQESLQKMATAHTRGELSDMGLLDQLHARDKQTEQAIKEFTGKTMDLVHKQESLQPKIDNIAVTVKSELIRHNLVTSDATATTKLRQ